MHGSQRSNVIMLFTQEVSFFPRQSKNKSAKRFLLNFSVRRGSWWIAWNEWPKRILEAWNELDWVVNDVSALAPTSTRLHRVSRGTVCVLNLTTFKANYLGYAYLNCDSYHTLRINEIWLLKFVLNVPEAWLNAVFYGKKNDANLISDIESLVL